MITNLTPLNCKEEIEYLLPVALSLILLTLSYKRRGNEKDRKEYGLASGPENWITLLLDSVAALVMESFFRGHEKKVIMQHEMAGSKIPSLRSPPKGSLKGIFWRLHPLDHIRSGFFGKVQS